MVPGSEQNGRTTKVPRPIGNGFVGLGRVSDDVVLDHHDTKIDALFSYHGVLHHDLTTPNQW